MFGHVTCCEGSEEGQGCSRLLPVAYAKLSIPISGYIPGRALNAPPEPSQKALPSVIILIDGSALYAQCFCLFLTRVSRLPFSIISVWRSLS